MSLLFYMHLAPTKLEMNLKLTPGHLWRYMDWGSGMWGELAVDDARLPSPSPSLDPKIALA